MKAKKKYVKFRHQFLSKAAMILYYPYMRFVYGLKSERLKDQKKRPYLIMFNHQTSFDQCFFSLTFPRHQYIVATEDIFNLGFLSKLLRYSVYPIAFKKSTTDARAVMECIKIAREGGSIAVAPEGNRTYSGKTETIKESISKFAKKLGLPIALIRLEGGYGVKPRWADKIRKSGMTIKIHRVIEPSEYNNMTDSELYEAIKEGLYVNESYREKPVKSKHLAEYLERLIYICPKCGMSEFESHGDKLTCKHCNYEVTYNGHNEFNEGSVFKNVNEWYEYQEDFIHKLSLSEFNDNPIYLENVQLYNVIVYKSKELITDLCEFGLYKDKYTFKYLDNEEVLMFDDISTVSVLGKNKLNIYYKDKLYQIKGDKRFNAVKYMHFYYHYANIKKGEIDNDIREFLGL